MMSRSSEQRTGDPTAGHDLMARFDMAHDRADRSPEVRAYLENLRPQILKLQRELRLQTEEDIAGLDRRDDLDMNEVDKLTGLIQAFRKAWKENRISVTEARRYAGELARRTAGPAFLEYARNVRETIDDPKGSARDALAVVRATARGGEWKLARELHKTVLWRMVDGSVPAANTAPSVDKLSTSIAVAESAYAVGITSANLFEDLAGQWFDEVNEDDKRLERLEMLAGIGRRLVELFAKADDLEQAVIVAKNLPDLKQRLDALIWLKRLSPTNGDLAAVLREFDSMHSERHANRARYFFLTGQRARGMAMLPENLTSLDTHLVRECVVECARSNDAERAFGLLARTEDAGIPTNLIAGPVAVAFLEQGDLQSAERVLSEREYLWECLRPTDAAEIIMRLDGLGARDLAKSLLAPFARIDADSCWEHAEAVRRVATYLSETGGDSTAFLALVRRNVRDISEPFFAAIYETSLRETETAIALRAFKRAAKAFRPEGPDKPFDPNQFAEVMGEIFSDNHTIAEYLRYDAPL